MGLIVEFSRDRPSAFSDLLFGHGSVHSGVTAASCSIPGRLALPCTFSRVGVEGERVVGGGTRCEAIRAIGTIRGPDLCLMLRSRQEGANALIP
jgi:hypothetical protein